MLPRGNMKRAEGSEMTDSVGEGATLWHTLGGNKVSVESAGRTSSDCGFKLQATQRLMVSRVLGWQTKRWKENIVMIICMELYFLNANLFYFFDNQTPVGADPLLGPVLTYF